MARENPWTRRRVLSLFALAACIPAVPGCGEPAQVAPPPEAKSTNSEMIDFMKSEQEKKKKKK